MKRGIKLLDIGTRLIVAGIFAYSAFMKFSGAAVAVHIFRLVGMEPAGRYGVAVIEIIAIILLLIPKTAWRGALLGAILMFGAICMHLSINQVVITPDHAPSDGGVIFISAIVVLFCCISILVIHKTDLVTELN